MINPKKAESIKGYYQNLDPKLLITPDDLLLTFEDLVEKTNILEQAEAPKMLVTTMRSLALEIEIGRHHALAVMNPKNPEPLIVGILAYNDEMGIERVQIIRALKNVGWTVKSVENLSNVVQLTVTAFEPAKI